MIAKKKLSPVGLMDTALERAEALNPRLNAICAWAAHQHATPRLVRKLMRRVFAAVGAVV